MTARRFSPDPAPAPHAALRAWIGLGLVLAMLPLHASCVDEATTTTQRTPDPVASREAVQKLVGEALARSSAVGAARMTADAALRDTDEARAAGALQISATAGLGPSALRSEGSTSATLAQARAGLSLSQLISDGGRTERLIDWRERLADAARLGWISSQEQVALNTVSLALERSRYLQQVQVYAQYVGQMGCLVGSLEQIVSADRGRLSELVQARKSMSQAELSQEQAASQVRQATVKLRRMAGEALPDADALLGLLLQVPELAPLQAELARSTDIAQLDAQAEAARQLARSVEAALKPQFSWSVAANTNAAAGGNAGSNRSASISGGLSVSIPLLSPGAGAAADAARKRAEASQLARDEVLEQRQSRLADLHEQARAAMDRARRVAGVLGDSNRVRDFTLQQWQQLGRRSLFDVMAAEGEHYNLRVAQVNALHDGQQLNALLESLSHGINQWVQ